MIKQLNEFKSFLKQENIPCFEDVSLSSYCSFRIGGISPLLCEVQNNDHIFIFISAAERFEIPWKILGGGTNILISDHPDDFVILQLGGVFKEYSEIQEGLFRIGAAALTTPVFRKISQSGYTGLEFLSTIPGSVGGAVIQNAGCYGGELFDFTIDVEFIREGRLYKEKRENIQYGYRNTQFLKNKDSLITSVTMTAQKGDIILIEESLKEKRDKRNSSQPPNKKSAGSVFKNPNIPDEKGNPLKAWQLIDRAGLRGISKGGARIAEEHCNFIVNTGGATAADVHYLIQLILEKVSRTSGILLEREIEFFGQIP